MDNESITAIRHALQDYRREALAKFMGEFITTLKQEGFSYKDLLDAIANWSNEQPGLEKVVNHLEAAINEIYQTYKP